MSTGKVFPVVTATVMSDDLGESQYREQRLQWIQRDRFGHPPWIILAPFDSIAKPGFYTFGIYHRIEGLQPGHRIWHSIRHAASGDLVWRQNTVAESEVIGAELNEMEGFVRVRAEFDRPGAYIAATHIGQDLDSAEVLASMRFRVEDG